jgi:hypothetical protein
MIANVELTGQTIALNQVTGTTWLTEDTSLMVPQLSTTPGVGVVIPEGIPRYLQVQLVDQFPRTLFLQKDIDDFMAAWELYRMNLHPIG